MTTPTFLCDTNSFEKRISYDFSYPFMYLHYVPHGNSFDFCILSLFLWRKEYGKQQHDLVLHGKIKYYCIKDDIYEI